MLRAALDEVFGETKAQLILEGRFSPQIAKEEGVDRSTVYRRFERKPLLFDVNSLRWR